MGRGDSNKPAQCAWSEVSHPSLRNSNRRSRVLSTSLPASLAGLKLPATRRVQGYPVKILAPRARVESVIHHRARPIDSYPYADGHSASNSSENLRRNFRHEAIDNDCGRQLLGGLSFACSDAAGRGHRRVTRRAFRRNGRRNCLAAASPERPLVSPAPQLAPRLQAWRGHSGRIQRLDRQDHSRQDNTPQDGSRPTGKRYRRFRCACLGSPGSAIGTIFTGSGPVCGAGEAGCKARAISAKEQRNRGSDRRRAARDIEERRLQ